MIIGKHYKFDAAHFLPRHPKCGKTHGHTWHVTVEVEGPLEYELKVVMDFHELDEIVKQVIAKLDHTNLNDTLPMPTAEVLTTMLASAISAGLPKHVTLHAVQVQEGDGGWARYEQK